MTYRDCFSALTRALQLVFCALAPVFATSQEAPAGAAPPAEIIYYVLPRSFYDSNGDGQGDLAGLRQKLDYLQELGITSVLTTPLYYSWFYHNYFAIDYRQIDPEYGTEADLVALIRELHRRGMKFYLDMETQYVTEDDAWYRKALRRPKSKYNQYFFRDSVPMVLQSYHGESRLICRANLYHPEVKKYFLDCYLHWLDPNGDGRFDDGVDGFRIDHIMDDLDYQGRLTGLLAGFWKPLLDSLRARRPDLKVIGEQADWTSYGSAYFEQAGLDAVFAFRIAGAIMNGEKTALTHEVDTTYRLTPAGKGQLIFIENHDLDRYASRVNGDLPRLKAAAALNLLLRGTPLIYYGQELGMQGKGGGTAPNDANDIPRREAFEWFRTVEQPGMALWYKDTGPWWTHTNLKSSDGISLEEEKADSNSLWHCYRQLIALRRQYPALRSGNFQFLDNRNDNVLSFLRWEGTQAVLVVINLDAAPQLAILEIAYTGVDIDTQKVQRLWQSASPGKLRADPGRLLLSMAPYAVEAFLF